MVATSDLVDLERLALPHLRINAPVGRVLTREQFLTNMRSGDIAAEAFTRTPEDFSVSGSVASVMGRETFTPSPSSELGRTFAAKPLERRYINVYVSQNGRWRWLARHANVVSSASKGTGDPVPAHHGGAHTGVPELRGPGTMTAEFDDGGGSSASTQSSAGLQHS
jgi:hypothetical protein